MNTGFNLMAMPTKKTAENPIKIFNQYLDAVWMDFENVKEMDLLNKVARSLKPKNTKRKKK